MKPQKIKRDTIAKHRLEIGIRDDKDAIIDNQKSQILGLRKALQRAEAKLIAAGY